MKQTDFYCDGELVLEWKNACIPSRITQKIIPGDKGAAFKFVMALHFIL
jgi:hypothetical protein